LRPDTPDQAVGLLQEHGDRARLMMGGTDLLPALRDGLICPEVVIDVKHIDGMRDVQHDPVDGLRVGAAATMNELARHPDLRAHYSVLAEAASTVASYQIRNRATLGGNICNASPCADTSPAVLVLEGEVVLYGPAGERVLPAAEFFQGPGQTAMGPDELMTSVRFPVPPDGLVGRYLKLGRSKSGDLALVGVAVAAYPGRLASLHSDSNGRYPRFRMALGSVAPVPLRATAAEEFLNSREPTDEALEQAAERAMKAASPITDVRGGAEYQTAMVRTLTLRALRSVRRQMGEAE
jgi:carbon-monoxide dehydrogenase medium subunit